MKTVKVRIAVAVDPEGNWNASGWSSQDDDYDANAMGLAIDNIEDGEARYWVTAELEIPTAVQEVAGSVERA